MSHGDDFIISVHALERFEERFPTLWTSEDDVGYFIYEETMDALENDRVSFVLPVEFASNDLDKWDAGRSQLAWTVHRTRGYVLHDNEDGLLVATVLLGRPVQEARAYRYRKSKSVPLRERNQYGFRVNKNTRDHWGNESTEAEAGVGQASAEDRTEHEGDGSSNGERETGRDQSPV